MIGNYLMVTKSKKNNRKKLTAANKRCDTDQRSIATEQFHHNTLVVQSAHPPSISTRLRTFQTNSYNFSVSSYLKINK